MITSQNRPGLSSFLRVTLKTWDGLGTRLARPLCPSILRILGNTHARTACIITRMYTTVNRNLGLYGHVSVSLAMSEIMHRTCGHTYYTYVCPFTHSCRRCNKPCELLMKAFLLIPKQSLFSGNEHVASGTR